MEDDKLIERINIRASTRMAEEIDAYRERCAKMTGIRPSRGQVIRLAAREFIQSRSASDQDDRRRSQDQRGTSPGA